MVLQGEGWVAFQLILEEHFQANRRLEVLLGLGTDLSAQQLASLETELLRQGVPLLGRIELGTNPWPITLRLVVRSAPSRGSAAVPLVVLIIGALGAVGLAGVLGWRIGEVVKGLGDALVRGLIPLTLILGTVYLVGKSRR